MTEIHNALFFGKIVNVKYKLKDNRDIYGRGSYGQRYYSRYNGKPEISQCNEFVKYEQFYNCDFEKPPLEKGEKVYINELDLTLAVLDRVRSTNGEYCYYVEHVIEVIDDDKSAKSFAQANIELKKEIERYNEVEGYKKRVEELEQKQKKKWYHFFK